MSLEFLTEMLEEAKPILLKAGLTEVEVGSILDYRVDHTHAYTAVAKLVGAEVQAWRDVRAKVTESMWDYYEATGERELIECRQLRKASSVLRKAWREQVKPFYESAKRRKETA